MKKLLILAVALVAAISASAQQEAGSFSIAPKFGFDVASLTKANESSALFGVVGGVDFTYQAANRFGLSFGAFYSGQGVKGKSEGFVGGPAPELKLKYGYLNIPVLANIYVCKGLALKAGVQPGFLISAKGYTTVPGFDEIKTDMKDNCEKFDLSIPVGISYEFANCIFDARYNIGMTKTAKGDNVDGSKNSVFMLTFGYKFCL